MNGMQLDEQSIFVYLPELEPVFGAYSLLSDEKAHTLCTELYGSEKIAAWRVKYRFLFEIYGAIREISPYGFVEHLLDIPVEEFSLEAFQKYLLALPTEQFLYRHLDWRGEQGELEAALTEDEALDRAYQSIAEYCPSFLGFATMVRQSRRYIQEFFALVDELQDEVLCETIASVENKVQQEQSALASEVKEIGPFECSQLRMGKTFHNRGPYDEFYFIPSLLLPGKATRFFRVNGENKRQILFLSLRAVERSQEDILRSLKALSDATRYRILMLLAQGTPLRGLDIAKRLSLAPSTVSHHMEQLKEGGLITEEPVKNSKYYGICRPNVAALLRELKDDFKISNEIIMTNHDKR